MTNIYTIISIVAFILSGIFFIAAITICLMLNVRGTYIELKEQTDKDWYRKREKQKKKAKKNIEKINLVEVDTTKHDVDDEAMTVMESGEIATDIGLVGVYEPGTDLVETERTEMETVKEDVPNSIDEEPTDVATEDECSEFTITKKVVKIHSEEIIF